MGRFAERQNDEICTSKTYDRLSVGLFFLMLNYDITFSEKLCLLLFAWLGLRQCIVSRVR